MTTIGSLCTGFGGIELGLELAGVDVDLRWYAEIEPGPAELLSKRHPGVPNLGDITRSYFAEIASPVDMIVGGIPCQPTSAAGRRLGATDPRWLWPTARNILAEMRPQRFLLENVRGLVSFDKGALFDGICTDMLELGYGVRWLTLGACAVGLAHHRHRVFLLATYGDTSGVQRLDVPECGAPRNRKSLLPTATARDGDGRGTGDMAYWGGARAARTEGRPLDAEMALLFPTPTATAYGSGGNGEGNWNTTTRGAPSLDTLARSELLPTPTAADGSGRSTGAPSWDRHGMGGRNGSGNFPLDVTVDRELTSTWGRFGDAVARHAHTLRSAPPEPTEPNRNGAPRLAPPFVEWLMGLPAGHVTDVLGRMAALKALGNGVVPLQLATAWRQLTGQLPANYADAAVIDTPNRRRRMPTTQEVREIEERRDAAVLAAGRGAVEAVRGNDMPAMRGSSVEVGRIMQAVKAAADALGAYWRAEAERLSDSPRKKSVAARYVASAEDLSGMVGHLQYPSFIEKLRLTMLPDDPSFAEPASVDPMPGMWEPADVSGGATDTDLRETIEQSFHGDLQVAAGAVPIADAATREIAEEAAAANAQMLDYLRGDNVTMPDPQLALAGLQAEHAATYPYARLTFIADCDACGKTHDLIADHCEKGEHCISTDAACNADLRNNDHGVQCCICKTTMRRDDMKDSPMQPSLSQPAIISSPAMPPEPGAIQFAEPAPIAPLRLTWEDFVTAMLDLPIPTHGSFSSMTEIAECGMRYALGRLARHGKAPAEVPAWWNVGGNAFHATIENVERVYMLRGELPEAHMLQSLWLYHLGMQRDLAAKESTAPESMWRAAGKGKENFDWWRVQGEDMLRRYLRARDDAWRMEWRILTLPDGRPGIELAGTLDLGGWPFEYKIDQIWQSASTGGLFIPDLKSGSTKPASTLQLGVYAHAVRAELERSMSETARGALPAYDALTQPIAGAFYDARAGSHDLEVADLIAAHPLIGLRAQAFAAKTIVTNRAYLPHLSNLPGGCTSCVHRAVCPAQS